MNVFRAFTGFVALALFFACDPMVTVAGDPPLLISKDLVPGSGDGLITEDPVTGLEWLDLPPTKGQSYNAVAAGFGGFTTTHGFRFATITEVTTFLANAGLVHQDQAWRLSEGPAAQQLKSMMGCTTCSAGDPHGYGIADFDPIDPVKAQLPFYGFHIAAGGRSRGDYPDIFAAKTLAIPNNGSFLIRSTGAAGSVPNGATSTPLTLDRDSFGSLVLRWDPSCLTSDTDYGIYEGLLGDFASHTSLVCSTAGATTGTISPLEGEDTYYLVVPRNAAHEGSYGVDSNGEERISGMMACLPQLVATCPFQ